MATQDEPLLFIYLISKDLSKKPSFKTNHPSMTTKQRDCCHKKRALFGHVFG